MAVGSEKFDALRLKRKFDREGERDRFNRGFEDRTRREEFEVSLLKLANQSQERQKQERESGGGGITSIPLQAPQPTQVGEGDPGTRVAADNARALQSLERDVGTPQTTVSPTSDPRTQSSTTVTETERRGGGVLGQIGRLFNPDFLVKKDQRSSTTTGKSQQFQRGLDQKASVIGNAMFEAADGVGDPRRVPKLIQQQILNGDLRPDEIKSTMLQANLIAEDQVNIQNRLELNAAKAAGRDEITKDPGVGGKIFKPLLEFERARTPKENEVALGNIIKVTEGTPLAAQKQAIIRFQSQKAESDAARSFLETQEATRLAVATNAQNASEGIGRKLGFTAEDNPTPLEIQKELRLSFLQSDGTVATDPKSQPLLNTLNRQQFFNGAPMTPSTEHAKFAGFGGDELFELDTLRIEKDLKLVEGRAVTSSGEFTGDSGQADRKRTEREREEAIERLRPFYDLTIVQPGEPRSTVGIGLVPNSPLNMQLGLILQGHNYLTSLETQGGFVAANWRDLQAASPGEFTTGQPLGPPAKPQPRGVRLGDVPTSRAQLQKEVRFLSAARSEAIKARVETLSKPRPLSESELRTQQTRQPFNEELPLR